MMTLNSQSDLAASLCHEANSLARIRAMLAGPLTWMILANQNLFQAVLSEYTFVPYIEILPPPEKPSKGNSLTQLKMFVEVDHQPFKLSSV